MNIFLMNFKRNMKAAFITVKSNFKEYVCFLIALVMVQMLFGVLAISFYNNRKVEKQIILEEGYDYHCYFEDLEEADINLLISLRIERANNKNLTFSYLVSQNNYRIVFEDDYKENYQFFQNAEKKMNEGYEHISLHKTPLYDFDSSSGSVLISLLPLLALLMLLSYGLITALFRIRLNHFKFTYGVYMTFGADTKKLFSAAFYEMMLVVFIAYPFSVLLSYGAAALLYLPAGNSFGFYFPPLPLMLICSLVCALLSLILPIKLLGRSSPNKLLKAEDNSNLVSSARKSANFLKKSPFVIELRGLWRFRKYIVTLLLSTVTFAVVFLLGCYLSDAYAVRTSESSAAFTVKIENPRLYDYFTRFFKQQAEFNNVDAELEKTAVNPYSRGGAREEMILPNLALDKNLGRSSYFTDCPDSDLVATESLEIRAFDEDALACLDSVYHYGYSGDPSLLLRDPYAVVLSSALAGGNAMYAKPGDTVYLSVNYLPFPDEAKQEEDLITLDMQFEEGVYVYRAFKVAAVVDNYNDFDNMLVYLSTSEDENGLSGYEAVMGQKPDFSMVRIYIHDEEDEDIAELILNDFLSENGGISFDRRYGALTNKVLAAKNYRGMILLLSFLALAVSPLAGVFSQILFYGKRKLEFDVLRAVGAVRSDLFKIFFTDSAVIALISGACYVGLSFVGIRLTCAFLNSRIANFFSASESGARITTFYPTVPALPFVIGLILTLLFAVIGVVLPALFYKRSANAHIASDFSKDDD